MSKGLILPDFGSYDGKGPADLKHGSEDQALFNVQIARNTNATGEQIAISVPVYKSDSYADMIARLELAYHIPQLRLEQENKFMIALNEKQQEAQRHEELTKLEAQAKARVDNLLKSGKAKLLEDGTVIDKKGKILLMKPTSLQNPEVAQP